MRIHRIHSPLALEPGEAITLTGKPAHYLGRVLRVTPGQSIVLFNGDGCDYACEVRQPGKNSLTLGVLSRLPAKPESPLHIIVAQAISRGERMDQTLQKCTELGVMAFQPLWSERVEVRLRGEKLARRHSHWEGVVISACEQSGRAVIPQVLPPGAGERLANAAQGQSIELAVGPEGGFSAAELDMMASAGIMPVSLGPRILRTETAAPAAVAVLQALQGDF
ncbi:MAG: RsmE family RNA methyltransferase [Xanthomonadales bacterium]|nr:RsmE family RNA methyltransferase [Xanthomonadales bacterium]